MTPYRHTTPGSTRVRGAAFLVFTATLLVACGGGDDSKDTAEAVDDSNRAPTISGSPATSASVGATYAFSPSASDADGDSLTYSVQNKPDWATFNAQTGTLSGVPGATDVGTYSNIVIRVSDGAASTALPAFAIVVNGTSSGALTVSWDPPTTNDDGSTLTDLAGYRISYGTSPANLSQTVDIDNPGITSHMIENLTSGTWHFSLRAYSSAGIESAATAVVSATVP